MNIAIVRVIIMINYTGILMWLSLTCGIGMLVANSYSDAVVVDLALLGTLAVWWACVIRVMRTGI